MLCCAELVLFSILFYSILAQSFSSMGKASYVTFSGPADIHQRLESKTDKTLAPENSTHNQLTHED